MDSKTLPPFRKEKSKYHIEQGQVCNFIYQADESNILRTPSEEVNINEIKTKYFQKQLKYLKDCLLKYRKITGLGRGIAGVQVGISKKVAVIYTPKKLITIINPKIISKSDKKYLYPEGCMSASPVIAKVVRPAYIKFEYLDEKGIKRIWNKSDNTKQNKLLNRVFQHEIDHMEGIINIDLVKSTKDLIFYSNPKLFKNSKFEEI